MGQGLAHRWIQRVRAETAMTLKVIDLSSYRPQVLRQGSMHLTLASWMLKQELFPEGGPTRHSTTPTPVARTVRGSTPRNSMLLTERGPCYLPPPTTRHPTSRGRLDRHGPYSTPQMTKMTRMNAATANAAIISYTQSP